MRHKILSRTLGRRTGHRKSMLMNMSNSLIQHELIKTTLIRAKVLRRYLEPLITLSKSDSVHYRRQIFAELRDPKIIKKLFEEIGPRYKDRPGGYVRIIKAGFRNGDAAPVAYIQLV
jgi:large subunit ribosomal protein L17